MRPLHRLSTALIVGFLTLVFACASDDDETAGPGNPTDPGTAEALAGYWDAGDEASAALGEANDLWEAFALLAEDPAADPAVVLVAAFDFAAACSTAADRLTAWYDLEQAVEPYGGGKAMFTAEARETALRVLATAAAAATTSGEGLIVGWQTLGGLLGLREALADPEGTLPVDGILAEALADRLDVRDAAVTAAILADDDHDGLLPLGAIAGASPAERAATYADLDPNDPVKRACRAAVPRWDADERGASLALLERAARGNLRLFGEVRAGGTPLGDLLAHLTGAAEAAPAAHDLTFDLRDAATAEPVAGSAVLVLFRQGQPAEAPRIALLTDVSAQMVADLPAGTYDVLALAAGWARAVTCGLVTEPGLVVPLSLSHLEQQPLVLEAVDGPAMAGAGARVDLQAIAASASGDPLRFEWSVHGGPFASLLPAGPACAFTPTTAGDYTAVVTVRDNHGHALTDSATIAVKPFAVTVFRTDFLNEQVADYHLNPGELDTLQLWVANRGDNDVVGTARVTGKGGLVVDHMSGEWTLDAGRQTRWKIPVQVPVDWDQPRAYLDFAFTVDGETLVQELDYRVDFYVELAAISSPVTSRIVTVSGTVANPSLALAKLVIDRDRNHVYDLQLTDGAFEQAVILPGSEETRRIRLEVSAESGLWRATAGAGFMAAIRPADFRATLFWDTAGTDVDLWVTDPFGERCYYAHQTTASGLELDVDDVTGYGPENITGEHDLPAGDYLVQIHYYSDHGTNLDSHCTVMITLHEGTENESVEVYEQTITDGQVWTVATVTWAGGKALRVVPPRAPLLAAAPPGLPAK